MVIKEYRDQHRGTPPSELFLHAKSSFTDEEWKGFTSGAPPGTNVVGVQIADAKDNLKLFRNSLEETFKAAILDWNSYAVSQRFGGERRTMESDGIFFPSVRHRNGTCIAAFWPNVVSIPVQERHLKYEWDGSKMTRYFDYQSEKWIAFE
jgi:hypothetical protein